MGEKETGRAGGGGGGERREREQPSRRVDDDDNGRSADGRDKERWNVRRRESSYQGSDSQSSDGTGSDSSDLDDRRRGSRYTGERDGRERDRGIRGSERRVQEQEHRKKSLEEAEDGNRKRRDVRGRNDGQKCVSESSSEKGSDTSDSDSRHQSIKSARERDEREKGREKRGTERQEKEKDHHRLKLKEAEDGNMKRSDARNKIRHQESDSESSGEENNKKRVSGVSSINLGRYTRGRKLVNGESEREEIPRRGVDIERMIMRVLMKIGMRREVEGKNRSNLVRGWRKKMVMTYIQIEEITRRMGG